MKAHRSLRNVVLLPSLALVTFSAVAAAPPGHGIGSNVRIGPHHAAGRYALRAHDVAARSRTLSSRPWMYVTITSRPWMYGPWMYGPWMYGRWMYGPWMYSPRRQLT